LDSALSVVINREVPVRAIERDISGAGDERDERTSEEDSRFH
jgi:hypothetical protein